VINKYYFPLATSKTILFDDIETVKLIDCDEIDNSWGLSTALPTNWFNFDKDRKGKKKFIEITMKDKKIRPSITPNHPDRVFKIIWEGHTKEGLRYHDRKVRNHMESSLAS
jgi:hypothetical protein